MNLLHLRTRLVSMERRMSEASAPDTTCNRIL